jgi:hypothetical protein
MGPRRQRSARRAARALAAGFATPRGPGDGTGPGAVRATPRGKPESLRVEARRRGVTPYTVRKERGLAKGLSIGQAVGHARKGQPSIRSINARPMPVPSGGQISQARPASSAQRSLIGSYHNAVRAALDTGDESLLDRFRGKVIDGFELECDLDVLEQMGLEGKLDALVVSP